MVKNGSKNIYNDDDLLETKEIAEYLHISVGTVRSLIQRGEIPGGRLGRSFKSYFKNIKAYEYKILGGGSIQTSLPLNVAAGGLSKKISGIKKKSVKISKGKTGQKNRPR